MHPEHPPRRVLSEIAVALATPGGMVALFVVGLLIRLVLARGGGFPFDMPSFMAWSSRLADRGPWHFYPGPHDKYFVDYPPGYLYVLWIQGLLAKVFGSGGLSVFEVKIPPILGDLGLAWLVAKLAERLTPASVLRRYPIRGLAAAAVLLNPAFFFISAVWGQVDVFLALPVVGSFLLLGTGAPTFRREAGGMALMALAIGTKPQGAFVLPIVVLLLVWRHMRTESGSEGLLRVVALGAIGVCAGLVLLAPFHMGPLGALRFYAHSGGTYPVTSVFAFNFWGAIEFWRHDLSGAHVLRIFGIPALYVGLALVAVGTAVTLRKAWLALRAGEDEGRVLVFGSFALSLVGFALLTRIHERYLFLPLALGAALIGVRWFRRSFVLLSLLYLINVYFPYVYYLRFQHRPAPTFGGFFDAFFGSDYNGLNMKALAAFITVVALIVAWRGWNHLQPSPDEIYVPDEPLPEVAGDEFIAFMDDYPPKPKRRWTLRLHPVGRREAIIALAVFAVAFISRVAMLGHPPGMYFDEVYHARTGAEYLGGKEVFEWTHPPLGKEFIGFAIQHLSNFGARGQSPLPSDVRAIDPSDKGVLWATGGGTSFTVHSGVIDRSCSLRETGTPIHTNLQPSALAGVGQSVFVASSTSVLVRYDGTRQAWIAPLPGPAVDVALAGDHPYVLTEDHQLISVSPTGAAKVVATGATAIAQASRDKLVWAAFADSKRVEAWDVNGTRQRNISVAGPPQNISAIDLADRVFVTVRNRIVSIESDDQKVETTMPGGADALGAVSETGIAWAASGTELRAIEPHAAVVIGRVELARQPGRLIEDPVNHQIVAIAGNDIECASGRPQLAWRLGSAIFGAAMVGMTVLLAFLLFGNLWVALLSGLFLTVDGLAFSVSRIAMVDTYSIAFILASWFCTLSALREWGCWATDVDEPPPRKRAAILWLAGGGVFGGLGLASKWIGLYALVGLAILLVWDAFARGDASIWRVARSPGLSALLLAVLFGVVPIAIYVASYIPYFSLGHGFGDFIRLQRDMYNYHATLKATHPFGSPWFGWPFGYRAVFLYLLDQGTHRSEIWTFPNLVVFWGGLVAMGAALVHAVRSRSAAIGVVLLAGLIQYVPWVGVSRVTFMYHYLAVVPFLAIALAWWLIIGLRDVPHRRGIAIGVAVAAVAFFFAIFPMLVGWSMPTGYLDGIRHLFPWVIR